MKKMLEVFDDRIMLCDGCVCLFLPQFWGLAADCGDEQGLGLYSTLITKTEKDIRRWCRKLMTCVSGMKESDTGLAVPSEWDLVSDKQMMQEEQPLQVARCTNIINPGLDDSKYMINVKQIAKIEKMRGVGLTWHM
jgi:hypothetical protein